MKTISVEDIQELYKACEINSSKKFEIRTAINTGTLDNQLNSNFSALNKSKMNGSFINPSEINKK